MNAQPRSDVLWLVAIALFLIGRRKRKGQFGKGPPREHKVPDVLSLAQLRELASSAGMADADTGAAIAMAESGGRTRAVGDHGDSIGLWQINVPTAPKRWQNRDMLKHAGFNADAATALSDNGTNWERWTTYRNGSFRKWMPSK